MAEEIERKWVFEKGTDFDTAIQKCTCFSIEQYYIVIDCKGENRYRRKTPYREHKEILEESKYYYTEKKSTRKGRDIVRIENEKEVTKFLFDLQRKSQICDTILKKRYVLEKDGVNYEIDIYESPMFDKCILEIEFESLKKAEEFELNRPSLFINVKEVTDHSGFKNKNLARNGFPKSY